VNLRWTQIIITIFYQRVGRKTIKIGSLRPGLPTLVWIPCQQNTNKPHPKKADLLNSPQARSASHRSHQCQGTLRNHVRTTLQKSTVEPSGTPEKSEPYFFWIVLKPPGCEMCWVPTEFHVQPQGVMQCSNYAGSHELWCKRCLVLRHELVWETQFKHHFLRGSTMRSP
jgi:hypothetical protein